MQSYLINAMLEAIVRHLLDKPSIDLKDAHLKQTRIEMSTLDLRMLLREAFDAGTGLR